MASLPYLKHSRRAPTSGPLQCLFPLSGTSSPRYPHGSTPCQLPALLLNAPDLTLQPPPSRCPICFLYPLSPSNIAPILFIVYSPPSYPTGFLFHQGSSLSVCSLICLKGPGQCLIHSRCETAEGLQGLRRPHSSWMCLAWDKGSPGLTQLRSVPQAQPVTADRSSEDPSQDSFSTHHLAARRLTCLS